MAACMPVCEAREAGSSGLFHFCMRTCGPGFRTSYAVPRTPYCRHVYCYIHTIDHTRRRCGPKTANYGGLVTHSNPICHVPTFSSLHCAHQLVRVVRVHRPARPPAHGTMTPNKHAGRAEGDHPVPARPPCAAFPSMCKDSVWCGTSCRAGLVKPSSLCLLAGA